MNRQEPHIFRASGGNLDLKKVRGKKWQISESSVCNLVTKYQKTGFGFLIYNYSSVFGGLAFFC